MCAGWVWGVGLALDRRVYGAQCMGLEGGEGH